MYSLLLNDHQADFFYSEEVAENKTPYHILTERHLQAMWLEQKYFRSLKTLNGDPIEVVSPGIWNSEAGPDFLKAHIKIGCQEWRGDIELHLSQEGWYYHNHHLDVNYNHVILHVCYWQPTKERASLTSQGKIIPAAYLQPSLTISEARIIKLIDLDLYPYKHFSGSGNCSRTLFNQLPKDKTATLLRAAASWRLKEKYKRLQAKIDNPRHYVIGGIAMVLGYKHNAEAFLAIFHYLNSERIRDEQSALSMALGVTDFFNPRFQKKWSNSPYYLHHANEFESYKQDKKPPIIHLKLDKIRPANHPIRRLALLAKMMNDPNCFSIAPKLLSAWEHEWESGAKQGWKKLSKKLIELIPSYTEDYWESHYTFEVIKQAKPIALMGEDLKREILINVYLPILYADIDSRYHELEKLAFVTFYSSLKSSKTKKSAYLNYRFFGNKQEKALFLQADLQQGAYQIHRDFCVHFEASCQGCPFVDRYKKSMNGLLKLS